MVSSPLPSKPSHFYVSPNAIRFEFNALGDPDNVSVSIYSNAKIAAYVREVPELGFTPADEYRKWTLSAFPTHFNDNAGVARYCHVAVQRDGSNATLVYPDARLDIYGRAISDDGTRFLTDEATPIDDYFFFYVGKISSSDYGREPRHWTDSDFPVFGMLDTARYYEEEQQGAWSKMFTFNDFLSVIEQHYPILVSEIKTLVLAGKRILGVATDETADDDDERIITTAQASKRYLSRKHDDTAEGNIMFKKNVTVEGTTELKGNTKFGDNAGSSDFNAGLLGNGWRIDKYGNGEMDSLSLRKFLEVPELRYNRINVHVGVDWQTTGAGLIESVDTEKQIVTLKLEDGEYGAIQKGHLCMGIWHQQEGNDTETIDEHNGNFHFAGFSTAYFKVEEFCNEDGTEILSYDEEGKYNKKYFKYSLREDWAQIHPAPAMSFAAYAHETDANYQWCIYSTTEYLIILSGMTSWTYGSENISYIQGRLDGFTIQSGSKTRQLEGIGIAVGKIYRWGNETVIDRDAQLINQQLYYCKSELELADFKAQVSKAVWTTTPQTPDDAQRYVYGYWLKTYYKDGSTYTTPSGKPTANDVFVVSMYGVTGDSALSARLSQDIIVLNTQKDDWEEDGVAPQPYLSNGTQHETITAELFYGLDRETITKATLEERDYIKNVAITYTDGRAVIAFDITEGVNLVKNTVLAITLWSERTDKNGYQTGITLAPSADGEDGNDGKAGQGVGNVVEEYIANEGEQPSADEVGQPTPSLAGFSEAQNVLWRRVTTYDTDNIIISRTLWAVSTRWGKDGKQGEKGAVGSVIRPCGEFDPTNEYVNETELDHDLKFIDVVLYLVEGEYHAFARTTEPYPIVNGKPYLMKPYDDQCEDDEGTIITPSVIWLPSDKYKFVATDFLLAENAFIKFLSGRAAFFTDKDGNIRLGLQGVTDNGNPMIFAGASNNDANNAPFRVYENGSFFSKQAHIDGDSYFAGNVTASGGNIGGFTIGAEKLYNNNYGASVEITDNNQITKIGKTATDVVTGQSCSLQAESKSNGIYNTALYLNATGAKYNYAFHGNGNGVLNGLVFGYKVGKVAIATGTGDKEYVTNLMDGSTILITGSHTSGNVLVDLPTLSNIRQCLGIKTTDTTTPFAIRIVYLNRTNYEHLYLQFRVSDTQKTELPWRASYNDSHWDGGDAVVQLANGDLAEYMLEYSYSESRGVYEYNAYMLFYGI